MAAITSSQGSAKQTAESGCLDRCGSLGIADRWEEKNRLIEPNGTPPVARLELWRDTGGWWRLLEKVKCLSQRTAAPNVTFGGQVDLNITFPSDPQRNTCNVAC